MSSLRVTKENKGCSHSAPQLPPLSLYAMSSDSIRHPRTTLLDYLDVSRTLIRPVLCLNMSKPFYESAEMYMTIEEINSSPRTSLSIFWDTVVASYKGVTIRSPEPPIDILLCLLQCNVHVAIHRLEFSCRLTASADSIARVC